MSLTPAPPLYELQMPAHRSQQSQLPFASAALCSRLRHRAMNGLPGDSQLHAMNGDALFSQGRFDILLTVIRCRIQAVPEMHDCF